MNIYLTIYFEGPVAAFPVDTVEVRGLEERDFHMERFKKWCDDENQHPLDGKYVVKEHENFPETIIKECA